MSNIYMNRNINLALLLDEELIEQKEQPSERMLLSAILERAILDYVGNDKKEAEEAQEWIFNEEFNSTPRAFSFQWICEELDLNHKIIARIISSMPKRGKHRVAPWYFSNDWRKPLASTALV
jgi:hypothetical protein